MSCIVLCSVGSDSLSKIDTENLKVERLNLSSADKPYGPHGIALYKDKILTANNYNNSISVIDVKNFSEEKTLYIGSHPNDSDIYKDNAYVLCGDSDSIIVYDLLEEKIQYHIKCGRAPHSIEIINDIGFAANMYEDNISVIDCEKNVVVKSVKVGNNPVKVKLSNNNKYLYVCISCLEYDKKGYINIIDLSSLKSVAQVEAGFVPVDLYEYDNFLYVSNLCSGDISIVNLNTFKEEGRIVCGGMPRGIVRDEHNIFICDYLNNVLKIIDNKRQTIKAIAVGREPNAMTFIKYSTDKL